MEELLLTPIEEELNTEKILYSAQDGSKGLSRRKRLIFVLLMTSFNFFFAGVEGSFKNFIPAFASSCSQHLSRQEGSQLSALFFGTYTVNRQVPYPAAQKHDLLKLTDCEGGHTTYVRSERLIIKILSYPKSPISTSDETGDSSSLKTMLSSRKVKEIKCKK